MSVLLLSAMLLTACAGDGGKEANVTTADTALTSEAVTTEALPSDNVPELDFGGAKFRSIQQNETPGYDDFFKEAEDGDSVNDAIFKRAEKAEERFNIVVEPTLSLPYNEVTTTVQNTVLAGEDAFDLVLQQFFASGRLALNDMFYNWIDLPYIEIEQPWYNTATLESTIGDNLYMVEGDLSLCYTMQTWLYGFNRTKAANYTNIPDLYQTVIDGEWTVDLLNEISGSIYTDLNGDSTRDENDFYGHTQQSNGCLLAAYYYGMGGRMISVDDDFNLTHEIANEHMIDILVKMADLIHTNEGGSPLTKEINDRRIYFSAGTHMFTALQVQDLTRDELRSMDDDYGVLPMPKFNEEQEDYATIVDGGADIMTVPRTITNPELVGAVIESMSAESYNHILPEYLNMALEQKGVRDEESIEILRDILASRYIDFGYMYDSSSGWTMKMVEFIKNPGTIASQIESKISAVTDHYEKVIENLTKE